MAAERRPWIAAVLNVLLPGLGHLYVGRPDIAVVLSLLAFLGVVLLYVGALVPLAPLNVALPFVVILALFLGGPVHAALVARRTRGSYSLKPYNRWYVYVGLYLVLGVLAFPAITGFFRTHLIEAFRVPSGSMEPTTRAGDLLYVAKWPPDHRRPALGRVVVFESTEEPGLKVIKRILGMPGDTLLMRSGELFRNGRPLREPYVIHIDPARTDDASQREKMRRWQVHYIRDPPSSYAPDIQNWGPFVVPSDSFFALGDNRDASYDSRYYGFVPHASIIGRPSVIYFSFDPEGPGSLLSRVRWARIGQELN
jgi:signal peptidase I